MKLKPTLAGTGLAALLCSLCASVSAEHAWSTYHWASMSYPFTLQVVDSTTPDWDVELTGAVAAWSASPYGTFDLAVTSSDDSSRTRRRCKMVNGQIRVCNDAYGYNGWLGMATIGIDGNGHIDRGTAKMNDSYSSYWTILGEKNHVMCQEVGHLFGLGHTSEDGSSQQTCMDYSMDPDSQWPNAHDYEQLAEIYSHTESYNTYAEIGGGGDGGGTSTGPCNAPPGKGCNKLEPIVPMGVLVHRTPTHETWVAPRRDGGLWVHQVTLAPE
jgi:hypothetical protein